MTERRH